MKHTFRKFNLGYTDLKASTDNFGRMYQTPFGEWYPSITTCLSILSEDWVKEWRNRVGHEEADRISNRAKQKGKVLHDALEKWAFGVTPTFGYDIVAEDNYNKVKSVLEEHFTEAWGVEIALYSTVLQVAGRADLIGIFDGEPTIIDYKTSSKEKDPLEIASYYLQMAFYAFAFQELTGIEIRQAIIIMAVEGEDHPIIYRTTPAKWFGSLVEVIRSYKTKTTIQLGK